MFLYADWVVCNGIEFLSATLSRPLSIIDKGTIVDTGSTDGTLEFAKAMAAKYPDKLSVIDYGSLAPDFDMSKARNAGWFAAPPQTTWHWNIADDEIYNWQDLPKLRKFLEDHENHSARLVNMHFHEYGISPEGRIYSDQDHQRVMIHRWSPQAQWKGVWGREALFYPDNCHTHRPAGPHDIIDPQIYYHHFNWLRKKQQEVVDWNEGLKKRGM